MCVYDRGKQGERGSNVQSAIKPDFNMSPARQVQTQMSCRYFDLPKRKEEGGKEGGKGEKDICHIHVILELPYLPVYDL